ncbi:MAG: hypothetical protein EOO01_17105 [Chitinophagaceae bacterium]|nr:MAG: hypothetical protein EOO01_17105 [Chitinophagaceae bacterium]
MNNKISPLTHRQQQSFFPAIPPSCRCYFLAVIFLLVSCKKDAEETADDELPVLGTCTSVMPIGRISFNNLSGSFFYQTSGGGKIEINSVAGIIITHKDYLGFKIELWGTLTSNNNETVTAANHENLNGKHIKDRFGSIRTIMFPDGAKMTFVTGGVYQRVESVTITDGAEVHHINLTCNKLEYSAISSEMAKLLDEEQPDGEAGAIEISATGLKFLNSYTEDVKGNKIMKRVELGEIFRNKPAEVNDYFDDPRLAHT